MKKASFAFAALVAGVLALGGKITDETCRRGPDDYNQHGMPMRRRGRGAGNCDIWPMYACRMIRAG